MRGVIYARYSSDNQREESIEGQIRENTAYAERNGITIVGHYIDRAYSAKTDNRPEFQRMIKDSARCGFDVIIVWKLDRFARNRYDSARYKMLLKKNDVRVISATEAISQGAEGIILEAVLEGMAEYYSADLSEKVSRGMKENALKCVYNGGIVPLGFKIDEERHYQIDPETAPIIVEIFTRYDNGDRMVDIIDDLNRRGIKNGVGRPFNRNSIGSIIKNRHYIGEYFHGDVVIPDAFPALINYELFDRVNKKHERNHKIAGRFRAKEKYILGTKLFCGKCKAMMHGDCAKKSNGTVYRYYRCYNKKERLCDKKAVKKSWIEDLVIGKIMELLMDDAMLNKIADSIMDLYKCDENAIAVLEGQLRGTQRSIDNLVRAIERGVVTSSTQARLEELEEDAKRLQSAIREEEARRPKLTKEFILFTLQKYKSLDLTSLRNREKLVDSLVNCIILYDDKIVITFNYENESVTIKTTEEISSVEIHSSVSKQTRSALKSKFGTLVSVFFINFRAQRFFLLLWLFALCEAICPFRRTTIFLPNRQSHTRLSSRYRLYVLYRF
ncbi:MAG: recombinase family protein [Clostridia bacterium]|nr:recombinase family protein [Clostridia bacterium]